MRPAFQKQLHSDLQEGWASDTPSQVPCGEGRGILPTPIPGNALRSQESVIEIPLFWNLTEKARRRGRCFYIYTALKTAVRFLIMTFHGGEASSDCPTEELPRAETVCGGSSSISYEGPPSKGVAGAQGCTSTVRTLLATTVFLSPRGFKEFLRREDGEMAPTTWGL